MTKEQQLVQAMNVEMQEEYVQIGAYSVHYVFCGTGPLVLFLHGANIGWGQWYRTLGPCASAFCAVAVDLPGAGGSTKVDYVETDIVLETLQVMSEFIEVLKKRFGVEHLSVVGHSFGGWLALQLAHRFPESIRSCVVSNAIGFASTVPLHQRLLGFYPFVWFLTKTAMQPTDAHMRRFLLSAMYYKDAEEIFFEYTFEALERDRFSHPFLFMHRLFHGFRLRSDILLGQKDFSLSQPCYVIFGKFDPIVSLKEHEAGCRALLPAATVEVYDAGHVPMVEQSELFNQNVLRFLTKHSVPVYGV